MSLTHDDTRQLGENRYDVMMRMRMMIIFVNRVMMMVMILRLKT